MAGAQVFGEDYVPGALNKMSDAGITWVRTSLLWSVAEPDDVTPHDYNWNYVDDLLRPLVIRDFTPIAVIYHNPDWAATTRCGPVDLVPLSRYGDFIGALVERYDGDGVDDGPGHIRVAHWEISNEQDFDLAHAGGAGDHGGCFGGDAPAYGAHLRTAYLAAKAADPTARVIFGGVAYDRFHNKAGYSPVGPFDYEHVGDTLAWLAANYGSDPRFPFFDRMGLHVYNDFRNNWDGTLPYDQELIGKVAHFREHQMRRAGVFDVRTVPILLSEAALASMPSDAYTYRSESRQAYYPGQLVARAIASEVEGLVWFSLQDSFTGDCDNPYDWLGFGLLRNPRVYDAAQACPVNPIPDYLALTPHEPKPSYDAYATALGALAGAAYDYQLDPPPPPNGAVEAHRFALPGGGHVVVAFADTGERIGALTRPLNFSQDMTFSADNMPDWTGTLRVTDHLGNVTIYVDTEVTLTLTEAPVYLQAE